MTDVPDPMPLADTSIDSIAGDTTKRGRRLRLGVILTLSINSILILLSGLGVWSSFLQLRTEDAKTQVDRENQITDRINKSVDQLGASDVAVQVGGIHALGRIAADSKRDQKAVLDILSSYLTRNEQDGIVVEPLSGLAPPDWGVHPVPNQGTQAAATVISNRKLDQDPGRSGSYIFHIPGAKMKAVSFSGAVMHTALLPSCSCSYVNFEKADLRGTYLASSDMAQVDFREANLKDVKMHYTDLASADFRSAKTLEGANFYGANLAYADFANADIGGADFRGALNVERAKGLDQARNRSLAIGLP